MGNLKKVGISSVKSQKKWILYLSVYEGEKVVNNGEGIIPHAKQTW